MPAASVTQAEVPAPASLVAELSVGNPKQTWQRLRLLGGPLADALPSSLPVLLTTSLSLPPSAAQSLDEEVPLVGVALERSDAGEPDLVLGAHIVSGPELVAALTLGDGAKFRQMEVAPRVTRLLPAPGGAEFDGALGVSGNYLLLATSVAALGDAGRFVAESVPRRARREPGFMLRSSERVLSGALTRRLRSVWQTRRSALLERERGERQAQGRPPDFADPEVLLSGADSTVESWLGVLESTRELSFTIEPQAERLRIEATLSPAADGAAALLSRELVVGPVRPLLQLPAGTSAALLFRSEANAVPGAETSMGASVAKLFGERLNAEQMKQLVPTLDAFSRTRRGATAIGLMPRPVPSLLVTCELADPDAFPSALADVLALIRLAPVANWLGGTLGKPSLELATAVSGQPRHAVIRFQRKAGASRALGPASLQVAWQARNGVGYVVLSPDAALGLSPFTNTAPLGALPWLEHGPAELGEQAALGFFADARLVAPGGPDEAPILLVLGKKNERIGVALDVSARALPALAGLFALNGSP